MRKALRFLAILSTLALLFCTCFSALASENDARFDTYVNMGSNAAANNYAIPHLFRQDAPYNYMSRTPLVVRDGLEYVPLSVFMLYSYIQVNHSETSENFFIVNNRNNHYVSFDVEGGLASTHDGDLLKINTNYFYKVRYVPARTVCKILGLSYEVYDNPALGVYAFRVNDGTSSKTLEQLITPFLPKRPQGPGGYQSGGENTEDPIEKISRRDIGLCFRDVSKGDIDYILTSLDGYRIKASFCLDRTEVLRYPAAVRRMYVAQHGILVTARAEGNTASEYANSLVEGLDRANEALSLVIKRKTRMCVLPEDIPDEYKNSKELAQTLKKAGYLVFTPNTQTDDLPDGKTEAFVVSGQLKTAITDNFDKETAANITALLWCSDKTPFYAADVANFVNKYEQFSFFAIHEAFLYNN